MITQPIASYSEKALRVFGRLKRELHFDGDEIETRILFKVGSLTTVNGCEVETAPMGSEKGIDLFRYLQKELQLPEFCKQFEVVFAIDDLVTIESLAYFPQDDEPSEDLENGRGL